MKNQVLQHFVFFLAPFDYSGLFACFCCLLWFGEVRCWWLSYSYTYTQAAATRHCWNVQIFFFLFFSIFMYLPHNIYDSGRSTCMSVRGYSSSKYTTTFSYPSAFYGIKTWNYWRCAICLLVLSQFDTRKEKRVFSFFFLLLQIWTREEFAFC